MTGVLNTDGSTPIRIKADPATNMIASSDSTTGSDFGNDLAARDGSGNPTLIAVSESDGTTPVTLYVDSSGNLLIDSL